MPNKYWVHLANGETKVMHSIGAVIDKIPVIGFHQIPDEIADDHEAEDSKDVENAEKENQPNE